MSEAIWLLWPPVFLVSVFAMPFKVEVAGANMFLPFTVLFAVVTVLWVIDGAVVRVHAPERALLAFVACMGLSLWHCFNAPQEDVVRATVYWLAWVYVFLVLVVTANSIRTPAVFRTVMWTYYLVVVVFSSVFLFRLIRLHPAPISFFYRSVFNFNQNDLAMLVNQALPLGAAHVILTRKRSPILLVSLGILLITLFYAGSRGGLVGMAVGITGALMIAKMPPYAKSARVLVLALLAASLTGATLVGTVTTRRALLFLRRQPGTYTDVARLYIMRGAMQVLREHPLVGVGIGRYWQHYLTYIGTVPASPGLPPGILRSVYETARPPHCLYVRCWAEGGILALACLVAFFYTSVKFMLRHYTIALEHTAEDAPYFWAFACYSLASAVHSLFYEGYMYPMHFFIIGMGLALANMTTRGE